ncbi:hypothetical protein F4680DRAFT_270 [Xylaria scruposa]|nr:hypothetical protein F4680DRAFT_270 [Xylaria scruposa]
MAKRQRAGDSSQEHHPPIKKVKSFHEPFNYNPEFYDNLTNIYLTRLALRELNRRTGDRPAPQPITRQEQIKDFAAAARTAGPKLARFARTGGPDLCDLRGCQGPSSSAHMMARQSKKAAQEKGTQTAGENTKTETSTRSNAADRNFVMHCINNCIYPEHEPTPEPTNMEEIRQAMTASRRDIEFKKLEYLHSEEDVMRVAIAHITGPAAFTTCSNVQFINLDSLTKNQTVLPKPDLCDGARMRDIDLKIRVALNKVIIPHGGNSLPLAPNFYLEAKGATGVMAEADSQAMLDGAYGSNMMHALQNYGVKKPIYDGKAYTFSATYATKTLILYAHHLSEPTAPERNPEFYVTVLDAYTLINKESHVKGITAFRNIRELARTYRNKWIAEANARARNQTPVTIDTDEEEQDSDNNGDPDDDDESQGADDGVQQSFLREDSPPVPPPDNRRIMRGRVSSSNHLGTNSSDSEDEIARLTTTAPPNSRTTRGQMSSSNRLGTNSSDSEDEIARLTTTAPSNSRTTRGQMSSAKHLGTNNSASKVTRLTTTAPSNSRTTRGQMSSSKHLGTNNPFGDSSISEDDLGKSISDDELALVGKTPLKPPPTRKRGMASNGPAQASKKRKGKDIQK